MNPPPLLRIGAFPSGTQHWRVDWFGDLSYPARAIRGNQPSVTVWLSRVVDDRWTTNEGALLSTGFTAYRQRISRKVALGTLVILRIGDLWRNQQLVARPVYETEQFQDILVTSGHVSIIKAGSSLADGSFVLPAHEHPWHMAATHSYCVQIGLPDGRFLVVPALELARFYFGSSSPLLTRLFDPGFNKEALCVSEKYLDHDGGFAEITLAPGIPRASAHDVARLVFGKKSMAKASLLSRSCVKAALAGDPVYPQAMFPFTGKTTLKVKGKWLSRSGLERQTFLVYELLSCTSAFPYKALSCRAATEETSSPLSDHHLPARNEPNNPFPSGRLNRDAGLQERDPGGRLSGKLVRVSLNVRFPDLRNKPLHDSTEDMQDSRRAVNGGVTDKMGGALGEPHGHSRVRSVELAGDHARNHRPPIPAFLRPLVGALRRFDGLASVLTVDGEDGWSIPVTEVFGLEPIRDLPEYCMEGRPRRLCAVDLRKGAMRFLLAACEGEPTSVLLTPWAYDLRDRRQAVTLAMIELINTWEMISGNVVPCDSGNEPETEDRILSRIALHFSKCGVEGVPEGCATLIR